MHPRWHSNHRDRGHLGSRLVVEVFCRNGILSKLKPFSIHDERSTEDWIDRVVARRDDASCSEVDTGAIILWIDTGIVAIPLFKIDVHHLVSALGLVRVFWDGNGLRD